MVDGTVDMAAAIVVEAVVALKTFGPADVAVIVVRFLFGIRELSSGFKLGLLVDEKEDAVAAAAAPVVVIVVVVVVHDGEFS